MTDLASWLLSQIAADEAAARATGAFDDDGDGHWKVVVSEGWISEVQADHIVRHDPARVLAECAAKKAIVGLHTELLDLPFPGEYCARCDHRQPCPTLRLLAQPYADREGFDPAWKVGT